MANWAGETPRESIAAGAKDGTTGHSADTEKQASASGRGKTFSAPFNPGSGQWGLFKVHENFYPHPSGGDSYLYCFMRRGYPAGVPVVLLRARGCFATGKKYRGTAQAHREPGLCRCFIHIPIRSVHKRRRAAITALMQGFDGVLEAYQAAHRYLANSFVGHSYRCRGNARGRVALLQGACGGEKTGRFCFLMGRRSPLHEAEPQFEQFPTVSICWSRFFKTTI